MANKASPAFQSLTGIYEPSGIQQLPDGRFLVVEDEKEHPFSLITIGVDGQVDSSELGPGLLQIFSDFWKLEDLEGLSMDRDGFVYAITSHSRDDDGDEKTSRERLVRFRVEGHRVEDTKVVEGLKGALTNAHPVLAAAAQVLDVKTGAGLNIEGLEITQDQQQLLIGFRGPLHEGRAIIARIENPRGMFEADEAPRVAADLDELDLGGQGIRGLAYVRTLAEYLIVSGPVSREKDPFGLWLWDGREGSPARRVVVAGLKSLKRAEGVCSAVLHGRARVIIVSDDGDRKTQRAASYLLLDLDQLQTAS
ncbi:DUF3616 domain-containing protein [Variovorax sp. J22R133]|uniref:DUF3616 domain-containing protein n=1 Tax=Variovorax brevis TaxID=3053503 RepID=UPI0025772640|nr:DUF3616 domain-containing protein [Variovorax sp. J22R133]MDM0112007.1 DUF3616 domain-containing protein [Variovorax sp. J22R133]